MQTIAIDFEAFYSKEFSLSKMTTRDYIMSPLFEVVGVSVQVGAGTPQWFSGSKTQTLIWLEQFDWENSLVIAHNAPFDGAILEWIFDIHPKMYFCTMMGSRPIDVPYTGRMGLAKLAEHNNLGAKGTEIVKALGVRRLDFTPKALAAYAQYCIQDTNLCYKLAKIYIPQYPRDELRNLDLTIKKFTRPQLVLDEAVIETRLIKHLLEKAALLGQCGITDPTELRSNDKFAELLRGMGVEPPMKTSPRTGKQAYAFAKTDQGFKDLLNHESSAVAMLTEARMGHKSSIEESRLRRFLSIAKIKGAHLPVPLLYWGAGTGRFSGLDKINLQNLPSRGEVGPALRKAIRAILGRKVLACDFAAIELRMVAAFCGQKNLLEQLWAGEDSYSIEIGKVYRIPTADVTKDQRFVGKFYLLSLQYGSGADKFLDTMTGFGVDMNWGEADRIVKYYRKTFSDISGMWRKLDRAIVAMSRKDCNVIIGPVTFKHEHIELPNGTKLIYNNLTKTSDGWQYQKGTKWVKLYGAMLLENISQALSRIVMTDAELVLADKGLFAAMSVHDELIYVPKDEHVEVVQKAVEHVMSQSPKWMPELPVACESNYGQSYYDAK